MNIHEKRRRNLLAIRGEYKQHKDLADDLVLSSSYLSQLLAEPEKEGSRNIGEKAARKIESHLNLDQFSLDLHPEPDNDVQNIITDIISDASPRTRTALERLSDLAASGKLTEEDMILLEHIAERIKNKG